VTIYSNDQLIQKINSSEPDILKTILHKIVNKKKSEVFSQMVQDAVMGTNTSELSKQLCIIAPKVNVSYDDLLELSNSEIVDHALTIINIVLRPYGPYQTREILMLLSSEVGNIKCTNASNKLDTKKRKHVSMILRMAGFEMYSCWDKERRLSLKMWLPRSGYGSLTKEERVETFKTTMYGELQNAKVRAEETDKLI